jgi:hypothetical protein
MVAEPIEEEDEKLGKSCCVMQSLSGKIRFNTL